MRKKKTVIALYVLVLWLSTCAESEVFRLTIVWLPWESFEVFHFGDPGILISATLALVPFRHPGPQCAVV